VSESDAERVAAVLATFDNATLHRTVSQLPKRELDALRSLLRVPAALLRDSDNAARIVQQRANRMSRSERIELALSLAAACNDDTVTALGPRHHDPSVDDMREILDPIVDRYGEQVVALMLAAYVDAHAPCEGAFAELLDRDPRFSERTA
jgi:hypothetical protein